jgi:hypothetical protein
MTPKMPTDHAGMRSTHRRVRFFTSKDTRETTVAKEPGHWGARIKPLKPLRGECRVFRV